MNHVSQGITPEVVSLFDTKWVDVLPSGCRIWLGHVCGDGYGQFHVRRQKQKAHRVSWVIANGPLPDGLHVLHRCDVPCCVNPDHLFLGTHAENMADKGRKGRAHGNGLRGTDHPRARLTPDAIREIRRLRGAQPLAVMAARFGISKSNVSLIQLRKAWAHVPD